MYREFYGLNEKPFSLTPDPQYLYFSEGHRTAMESLLYGIHQKEGFMVLTGDIGTGKTTLCRALLEKLDKQVKTAVIFNSFLNEAELLKSILQDLGSPSKGRTKKELVDDLNKFLIQQLLEGRKVVLIIDEAQNLSIPVLEQTRMLSNLETEKEKMLQIILLGQLELDRKLRSSKLQQLNQRVSIRHRLLPLTRKEMGSYILQRLTVAGAHGNITFSRSALREIYKFSKGIPRVINLLCDRALLAGFVGQTHHIDRKIVRKAKGSLLGEETGRPFSNFGTWMRRSIPVHFSLIAIFLSLIAGTTLSVLLNQSVRSFAWGSIQGIYSKVSDGPEQTPSRIAVQGTPRDLSQLP